MSARVGVAIILLVILGCALLANHQNKPFPLLISEAEAVTIVCNPVFVPSIPKQRKINRT